VRDDTHLAERNKGSIMTNLTNRMREILANADLESGEIRDVPLSTLYGLAKRRLVKINESGGLISKGSSTRSGRFPPYASRAIDRSGPSYCAAATDIVRRTCVRVQGW